MDTFERDVVDKFGGVFRIRGWLGVSYLLVIRTSFRDNGKGLQFIRCPVRSSACNGHQGAAFHHRQRPVSLS